MVDVMKKNDNSWMIGHKLKMFRQKQELSLQEAAERAGFTASFLSMVENGRSGIGLGNLQKILDIYGCRLADLSEEPIQNSRVLRLDQCEPLGYSEEGISSYVLVNDPKNSPIFPVHFRVEPGMSIGPISHDGEEMGFVIEGTFELLIVNKETKEEERYILEKWDTVIYPGRYEHKLTNISNQMGIIYSVIYCTAEDKKHPSLIHKQDQ